MMTIALLPSPFNAPRRTAIRISQKKGQGTGNDMARSARAIVHAERASNFSLLASLALGVLGAQARL